MADKPEDKVSAFLNTMQGISTAVKKFPLAVAGGTVDVANIVAGGFANVADAVRGKEIKREVAEGLVPKPVGGTDWLYEKFGFNTKSTGLAEDATAGALAPLTPGGAVKALIVPAVAIIPSSSVKAARKILDKRPEIGEEVFRHLGVYFGPHDNVARAVLSDADYSIKPERIIEAAPGSKYKGVLPGTLDETINHPALFSNKELAAQNYKDVQVVFEPSRRPNTAEYSREADIIYVGPMESERMLNSVVLHELQHAVQRRNKMTGGGSPTQFSSTYNDDLELVSSFITKQTALSKQLASKGFMPDEIEAYVSGKASPALAARVGGDYEFYKLERTMASTANKRREDALAQYASIYGEAEARAVQKMWESRMAPTTFPHSPTVFDIDPAETIRSGARAKTSASVPAKVPYSDAPNTLLGFKRQGPQKAFGAQTGFKHVEFVKVRWSDGTEMLEAMDGMNPSHALERARRNWGNATIESVPLSVVKSADPELVQLVNSAKGTQF